MAEVKQHPYTTVTAGLAFFGLVTFFTWAAPLVADSSDMKQQVQQVERKLERLDVAQQKRTLEDRLRQIDTELFSIASKVEEIVQAGRRPDEIYTTRRQELLSAKGEVERNLSALMQSNPWLANVQ